MASNSSTEVLRVTILSLDGAQCSTRDNGVSAATQQKVNISACAGFRSSTIIPKCIAVPSSQYTTLFHSDSSDDNILAVYSDELVIPCTDRSTNVKLHWNNKQKLNRHAPTNVTQTHHDIHPHSLDEQIVPHLEIELPSILPNGHQQLSRLTADDEIELHICVMCTSDENQLCTDNDDDENDSVDYEHYIQDIQLQLCYGVAYLSLQPSEAVGTRTSSSSVTKRQVDKVISLPIKRRAPPSSNYTNVQSTNGIQLSSNSTLSVQVERRCIPTVNHQSRQREQYHYIESKWRRDCSAPDSIIHNDSYNNNNANNNKEIGNNNGRLLSLFRRATSTLTSPRSEKKERHSMVGKVITVEIEPESGIESTLNRYERNNELSTSRPKKHKDKQATSDELDIPPSQTLSERFLCGATIPIISLKDALKMAANAGHHCDEDHVGLYVVDSDDSLGTSIAT